MGYKYENEKAGIFTERGVKLLLKMYDNALRMIEYSGAAMMCNLREDCSGDSWLMMACVDYLVEMERLHELTKPGTMGQYRTFTQNLADLMGA